HRTKGAPGRRKSRWEARGNFSQYRRKLGYNALDKKLPASSTENMTRDDGISRGEKDSCSSEFRRRRFLSALRKNGRRGSISRLRIGSPTCTASAKASSTI